mgnify:FL=1
MYLGLDSQRTNPNRLTVGVVSVTDHKENEIVPVPKPPSKLAEVLNILKIVGIALVTIAGSLLGLHAGGQLILPPAVLGVVTAIAGIGGALGLASGGIKPKADPDQLK